MEGKDGFLHDADSVFPLKRYSSYPSRRGQFVVHGGAGTFCADTSPTSIDWSKDMTCSTYYDGLRDLIVREIEVAAYSKGRAIPVILYQVAWIKDPKIIAALRAAQRFGCLVLVLISKDYTYTPHNWNPESRKRAAPARLAKLYRPFATYPLEKWLPYFRSIIHRDAIRMYDPLATEWAEHYKFVEGTRPPEGRFSSIRCYGNDNNNTMHLKVMILGKASLDADGNITAIDAETVIDGSFNPTPTASYNEEKLDVKRDPKGANFHLGKFAWHFLRSEPDQWTSQEMAPSFYLRRPVEAPVEVPVEVEAEDSPIEVEDTPRGDAEARPLVEEPENPLDTVVVSRFFLESHDTGDTEDGEEEVDAFARPPIDGETSRKRKFVQSRLSPEEESTPRIPGSTLLGHGDKHRGKRYDHICLVDPGYVRWTLRTDAYPDSELEKFQKYLVQEGYYL